MSFLNLTNVKSDDFGLIPPDYYPMTVVVAEMKQSKNNPDNTYLNITCEIFGSQFAGRKIFETLHIQHPMEKTRNISLSQLKKLLIAIKEKLEFNSCDELIEAILDKPFLGKVLVTPAMGAYPSKNVIKDYVEFAEQEKESDLPF